MKNLFRLGALVLLTGAFVSCSKSADSLADSDLSAGRMNRSRDAAASELWTKLYPSITEPRVTALGNPDSYLFTDDQAVFYVIISTETSSDSYSGTITLSDDVTGTPLQTYNLLPDTDPAAAGLLVPEEITQGQFRFLFVTIPLDSQYSGITVSMSSTVQQPNGETSQTTLPAAFTVL